MYIFISVEILKVYRKQIIQDYVFANQGKKKKK